MKLSQDSVGGFLKPSTIVLLSIGGLLSKYYHIYLAFLLLAILCVLSKNKRIVISAYLGYLLTVGYFVSCYSSFYEDWAVFFTIALPHVIGLIEILKDEQLYHYSMKIDLLYCIPIIISLFFEPLFIVLVFVKFLHMLYDETNLEGKLVFFIVAIAYITTFILFEDILLYNNIHQMILILGMGLSLFIGFLIYNVKRQK
jgi:hypothetical protein